MGHLKMHIRWPFTYHSVRFIDPATLLRGAHTLSSPGSSLSLLGEGAEVDDVIDGAVDDIREELS